MAKILITPKINPDLDGVACAYAYAKLLNIIDCNNQYFAGIYGRPQIEARFLLEKFQIADGIEYNSIDNFDKFIIVDASDIIGMPGIIRPEDVIEVIDHRTTHRAAELFPHAKIQIEPVGAAATLIFEKFQEDIPDNAMALIYGAIFSNTLNFKAAVVSQRDLAAVNYIEHHLNIKGLISEMFEYKTKYLADNLAEVLRDDFKVFGKLAILQIEGYDFSNLVVGKIGVIKEVLMELKQTYNLKYIFLTAADIKNNHNIFVTIDEPTKTLLAKTMSLSFDGNIARNDKLLLRKEMLPLFIDL